MVQIFMCTSFYAFAQNMPKKAINFNTVLKKGFAT